VNPILAALLTAGLAWLAWRAGTLTLSGAWAAGVVGFLVLLGTGWRGGAVLAAFFISSNLVSRLVHELRVRELVRREPLGRSQREQREPDSPRVHAEPDLTASGPRLAVLDPKADQRDAWQVGANGGVAALTGLMAYFAENPSLGVWIVTCALAAAAADTWATTLGMASRTPPRRLGFGPVVPIGTGGGMTPLGSAGALIGAAIVVLVGVLVRVPPLLLPVGTMIGFAGMVADSALGATLQGRFQCPACDQPSEWRLHRCGAATDLRGGMRWMDNDGVNFLSTAVAAMLGWLAVVWSRPAG
jgi:uncharacterized membrane protein